MSQGIFGQWGRRISPTARGSLFYFGISGASATFLPFINVFYADRGLSGREIGLLSAVGPMVALADRRGWQVQMMAVGLAEVALTTYLTSIVARIVWTIGYSTAIGDDVANKVYPVHEALVAIRL